MRNEEYLMNKRRHIVESHIIGSKGAKRFNYNTKNQKNSFDLVFLVKINLRCHQQNFPKKGKV